MGELFNIFFVQPIINVLIIIYSTLSFVHVPYALGFSIIILTIFIRFILYPFTASQLKASKKMQEISPHVSNIKEKHKGDSKKIQEETMRLYKEHGVNPAAGCLPMIIQLPIIWALYQVLYKIVALNSGNVVSIINKDIYNLDFLKIFKLTQPWDTSFLGIPLGQNPSHLISVVGPLILLAPVLTGVFQFVQSKMLIAPRAKILSKEKKKEDFSSAFQAQSLYIFPIMIGFFSYTLPFGLSLYWNTFTIFGILQQYRIQGLGGLAEWKEKAKTLLKK